MGSSEEVPLSPRRGGGHGVQHLGGGPARPAKGGAAAGPRSSYLELRTPAAVLRLVWARWWAPRAPEVSHSGGRDNAARSGRMAWAAVLPVPPPPRSARATREE